MKTLQSEDMVLGYKLKTRIGSGGYGEVWSAEAPGGISKAVKFVYGFHDEERAKTELKSLDRIKAVRHPFLISLERIQIVDGQLVVVTELAEKSLADLFKEYESQQQTGVPRDELLRYMRDAADGLDYLSQTHNLQHLDIKPENLLLLSGHVKIADFGLVKDLHNVTNSLMTGLTPIYAPPELFDGRPHRNSDQYSLAIVFTEMLTGNRPFTGSTPAQLAAQHIHGRPALQGLPSADQQVIARALSKDPNLRFASCREMVDELFDRKSRTAKSKRIRTKRDSSSETCLLGDMPRRDITAIVSDSKFPHLHSRLESVGPLDLSDQTATFQPTLVVSLGRFGADIVNRIRERVTRQFGTREELPSLGLLAVDTDRLFLSSLIQDEDQNGLQSHEVLPIPLKTTEQYRKHSKIKLDWMSRRWLYNIPRSGQTEGLRPLGRLVFADHSDAIYRRLKETLAEIIQPENVAASAAAVGLNAQPGQVRVYLVTSSAGGVGSGAVIDLAYAVRTILSELGVDHSQIIGLLAHSAPRQSDTHLLAVANTLALVTEMRHTNQFGYPGDATIGLPDYADDPVFDHTYLWQLGDSLSADAQSEQASSIAQYVLADSLTECQKFFTKARTVSDAELDIRSAQVVGFGLTSRTMFNSVRLRLKQALAKRWLDPHCSRLKEVVGARVEQIVDTHGLSVAEISKFCLGHAEPHLKSAVADAEHWLRQIEVCEPGELRNYLNRLQDVQAEFQMKLGLDSAANAAEAIQQTTAELKDQANSKGTVLVNELTQLIADPAVRLNGAKLITAELLGQLQQAVTEHRELIQQQQQVLSESIDELFGACNGKRSSRKDRKSATTAWRQSYAQAIQKQLVALFLNDYSARLIAKLSDLESRVTGWTIELGGRLNANRKLDDDFAFDLEEFPLKEIWIWFLGRMDQLVDNLDANLQHGWLHSVGGLTEVLNDPIGLGNQLLEKVIIACNQSIASAQADLSLEALVQIGSQNIDDFNSWLTASITRARPRLTEAGGQVCTLIASGFSDSQSEFSRALKSATSPLPTSIRYNPGELFICQELGSTLLANLVFRVMEHCPEALDLVHRLHTRTDIDWTELHDLFQPG